MIFDDLWQSLKQRFAFREDMSETIDIDEDVDGDLSNNGKYNHVKYVSRI